MDLPIFVLESCLNLIDINLEEKEYADDACPNHVRRIAKRISSDLCMYSESFFSDIDVIEYTYNSSHKFHIEMKIIRYSVMLAAMTSFFYINVPSRLLKLNCP